MEWQSHEVCESAWVTNIKDSNIKKASHPNTFEETHISKITRVTLQWHRFRASSITSTHPHVTPHAHRYPEAMASTSLALCKLSRGPELSHLSIGEVYCFRGLPLSCTGQSWWWSRRTLWRWKVYMARWKNRTFPASYHVIWQADRLNNSVFFHFSAESAYRILIDFFICLLLWKRSGVPLQLAFPCFNCSGNKGERAATLCPSPSREAACLNKQSCLTVQGYQISAYQCVIWSKVIRHIRGKLFVKIYVKKYF